MRIRTSCTQAIDEVSSSSAWPARRMRQLPPPAAGSCAPLRQRAARRKRSWQPQRACGTTTAEAKSGYGLTTESELQQLRVIRRLDAGHPVDLVPTFLGAHEVPVEYRTRRDEYVSLVIDEMIPRVQAEGLAEWCDVF